MPYDPITGVYTLPAGNPVVSGTTITSTWANTTLEDIALALGKSMTDVVLRDGSKAMSGNLQLMFGSNVTPSLNFGAQGAANTGLFYIQQHGPAVFGVGIAQGGVTLAKFTSGGVFFERPLVPPVLAVTTVGATPVQLTTAHSVFAVTCPSANGFVVLPVVPADMTSYTAVVIKKNTGFTLRIQVPPGGTVNGIVNYFREIEAHLTCALLLTYHGGAWYGHIGA